MPSYLVKLKFTVYEISVRRRRAARTGKLDPVPSRRIVAIPALRDILGRQYPVVSRYIRGDGKIAIGNAEFALGRISKIVTGRVQGKARLSYE